jgi:GntR family transcriptional regulator, rspAB operon transcriptional repressor
MRTADAARTRSGARGSLSDQAYLAVREEILRGQLRPVRRSRAGGWLASVVPVTDALRRLEGDGLVESRPRAGTRVRIPTEKDVRELYELREALESQSARLFAERATPAQCLELRRLAEQVDVLFGRLAAGDDDPAFRFAVHSHHVQLHMRIAEHAGSEMLRQAIDRNHVLILNWLFDVTGRRTPLPPGFHAQLAEALVSGDAQRADAAMRAHVRHGLCEVAGRLSALAVPEWRERRARAKGAR